MALETHEHSPSRSLKQFDIFRTLGTGSFGIVRLAAEVQGEINCQVALKIIKKASAIRTGNVENVKREKAILSILDYPSVPKFIGSFQDEDYIVFILEFVCGGELYSRMRLLNQLTIDHTRFYAVCIMDCLLYLHDQSIIYRDLKPENVLIDQNGYVKIVDFGLAKRTTEKTFTMCGTPEYLAPEIVLGRGHDKAVDWWAFGVLIYEMLTGHPPFYDPNPNGIYQQILRGKPEFPEEFSEELVDLLKGLMAVNARKRLDDQSVPLHVWFEPIPIEDIKKRSVAAPWVPDEEAGMTGHYYGNYPDSTEPFSCPVGSIDLFESF